MGVIGFLCVPLGSSTVQLNVSPGSRRACVRSEAGFSSQHGDRDREFYYRRTAFCCAFFFLWAKGLNAKDICKEMSPVCGGKCLLVDKRGKYFADNEEIEKEMRKWLG
jgi:hypothetical protein